MKFLFFALILFIFSIAITHALQFDIVPNVDAAKAKGTFLTETNSKKVCGDRLCSEVSDETISQKPVMITKKGLFPSSMDYTVNEPEIDSEKGLQSSKLVMDSIGLLMARIR